MYRQAFLLIMYKSSNSLIDLLKVLKTSGGDVFVHVDKKSDLNTLKKINEFTNVEIIKERFNISWGGFNMVKAMIALLKAAYNKNADYTHYVFLSGSDYPVWNGKKINRFFSSHRNKELVNAYCMTNNGCVHCSSKITKYYFFDHMNHIKTLSRIYNLFMSEVYRRKRKNSFISVGKKRLKVYFGSQWFAITNDCAKYVLSKVSNKQLINYFKHSLAPDEMFFHTIIFNSKFGMNNLIGGPVEYSPKWNLFNYTFLDSSFLNCGEEIRIPKLLEKIRITSKKDKSRKNVGRGSIRFLNEKYFDEIIKSGYPFCRKIDDNYSNKLISELEMNVCRKR
ncbi:hypothetical protein FC89_GL002116 [Liquorilactobacillus ghanensis DSM 18630]|uniref:Peptide O-xylosyltransferase n=1 Tax=Liquorilactobacillus ghanensis DSM 18630 TaxID=1423750 RepID=A0A0R1VWZ6_9LACO|nr:beta-1,6-N-acetylglucosaminyltransferase [Liquorilactobacillus ghanensis]KRM08004.1 hypothetical protein FC89_GL002116 [Liquorilactobacillus ghanensis DSM 18630]